jgi:hypothetical protein
MASFPAGIFSPRALVNLPGIVYDVLKTKILFAEDHNRLADEVVAIETTLGENPQGAYATVAARLADIPAVLPVWVKVAPTGVIDGNNAIFTLPSVPIAGSFALSLARQPQIEGLDYTVSDGTITYATAPDASLASEPHVAQYQTQ